MLAKVAAIGLLLIAFPLHALPETLSFFSAYLRSPSYFETNEVIITATVEDFAPIPDSQSATLTMLIDGVSGSMELENFSDLTWYYVEKDSMFVGFSVEKDAVMPKSKDYYSKWPRIERLLTGDSIVLYLTGRGISSAGTPVVHLSTLIIKDTAQ